jgi:predicted nucleotidyltransferase
MKPTLPIQLPQPVQDAIAPRIPEFCQRWKIEQLYLFGSVLRDDFRPDSDVDVMKDKRVICLDIPDEYEYMEPALMELLKKKVLPLLGTF